MIKKTIYNEVLFTLTNFKRNPKSQAKCRTPFNRWYIKIVITFNTKVLKNHKKLFFLIKKYKNMLLFIKNNSIFFINKKATLMKHISKTPDIRCQIEKVEDNCGVYIVKWGDKGRL